MKPKKITKKLSLNKKTIVELNNAEKKMIKGGEPIEWTENTELWLCRFSQVC